MELVVLDWNYRLPGHTFYKMHTKRKPGVRYYNCQRKKTTHTYDHRVGSHTAPVPHYSILSSVVVSATGLHVHKRRRRACPGTFWCLQWCEE